MADDGSFPMTFSVEANGYKSHVTVDANAPERASDQVYEWLEFQLRHLHAHRAGESVHVERR